MESMALPTLINDVTHQVLEKLVEQQTAENFRLDFKRDLPKRDEKGRNDFIADVSAFANSTGGDLLYGVDEDGEGRASKLHPLDGNRDEEVRRLQDYVLNSIEPRVPGVQVHAISAPLGYFVIVRVPQSWAGPHRVSTNQHFYTRENGRKRTLNIAEIRSLFIRSDAQSERIRNFRTERLGRIIGGETPQALVAGAYMVVHFVPTQAALGLVQVDPVPYATGLRKLPLLGQEGYRPRLNADGVLIVRDVGVNGAMAYSMLFRNGFFETVDVLYEHEGGFVLPSLSYEEDMIELLKKMRNEYKALGYSSELTCMLSIHRADEVRLAVRNRRPIERNLGRFDRQTLVLPDVLIQEGVSSKRALRPLFDIVWQSAGYLRSHNYDEDGNWTPQK